MHGNICYILLDTVGACRPLSDFLRAFILFVRYELSKNLLRGSFDQAMLSTSARLLACKQALRMGYSEICFRIARGAP